MSTATPVVVVTGGGTGIGAATARRFAGEGWQVVICGRREGALLDTAREIRDGAPSALPVRTRSVDVTSEHEVDALVAWTVEVCGRIDAWVNNAGAVDLRPLSATTRQQWDAAVQTNLTSVFLCSVRAAEVLSEDGSIVNVSSFTALIPAVNNGAYSVAKAGVLALTRVLASEYAPRGLRVNSVVPGYVRTEMGNLDIETKADRILEPISLRRFGSPDDIAASVFFLSSREASYISGTELVVSGGKFATQNAADAWQWEV